MSSLKSSFRSIFTWLSNLSCHTGNMVLNLKYVTCYYLVISRKGKTCDLLYQLFLLCLPISSLTMVAFFPAVFGDREVCSSLHLSKPVQPSPSPPRVILGSIHSTIGHGQEFWDARPGPDLLGWGVRCEEAIPL